MRPASGPPPAAPTDSDADHAARLARGFRALVGLTTGLIVLGAMVRAHGAGLACPDWPLCHGRVVPDFDLKVAFEVGHRAVAGTVSLLFVVLAALALLRPATRRIAGPWLAASAALLAVQVVLGALTVWHLLASWTVTSHLLTGNAVNASFALAAARLADAARGRGASAAAAPVAPALRAAVLAAAVALLAQLVLGGLVSSKFAALACDEWPACHAGEWFPGFAGARGIHLAHRLGAYTLVAVLGAAAAVGRGRGRTARRMALAFAVALAQVAVGVANVLLRVPVEVTGLHSLLAAVLVLLVAVSVREVLAAPDAPRGGVL